MPAIAVKAVALGDILDGGVPGRPSDHTVTVCDLCGLGVEDAAMAELAMST